MKCKLCQNDEILVKKSHIIPDFMYRDLFDEKHRLNEVWTSSFKNEKLKSKSRQTGTYEGQLLCHKCDNKRIGRLETYASSTLYGGAELDYVYVDNPGEMSFTQIQGIDYSRFKLFLLSLIWRASVSTLPMFKDINLGTHEETISKMILDDNPGVPFEYPCLLLTSLHLINIPSEIITGPYVTREIGGFLCFFPISGIFYTYFIGHQRFPPFAIESFIKKNGEIKIVHLPPGLTAKIFNGIFGINIIDDTN